MKPSFDDSFADPMVIDEEDYDDDSGSVSSGSKARSERYGEKELRDRIIKREERAVRNARIAVFLAIVACAAAVGAAIFSFATKNDKHKFELEVSHLRKIGCYRHTLTSF